MSADRLGVGASPGNVRRPASRRSGGAPDQSAYCPAAWMIGRQRATSSARNLR